MAINAKAQPLAVGLQRDYRTLDVFAIDVLELLPCEQARRTRGCDVLC